MTYTKTDWNKVFQKVNVSNYLYDEEMEDLDPENLAHEFFIELKEEIHKNSSTCTQKESVVFKPEDLVAPGYTTYNTHPWKKFWYANKKLKSNTCRHEPRLVSPKDFVSTLQDKIDNLIQPNYGLAKDWIDQMTSN